MQHILLEIEAIKARNKRVEADKAWETSLSRRISLGVITYIFMCVLMYTLRVESPFLSALVPTCGYLLSTFSLGKLKQWWLKRRAA